MTAVVKTEPNNASNAHPGGTKEYITEWILSEFKQKVVGQFGGTMQFLQQCVADQRHFAKELKYMLSSKYEYSVSKNNPQQWGYHRPTPCGPVFRNHGHDETAARDQDDDVHPPRRDKEQL